MPKIPLQIHFVLVEFCEVCPSRSRPVACVQTRDPSAVKCYAAGAIIVLVVVVLAMASIFLVENERFMGGNLAGV